MSELRTEARLLLQTVEDRLLEWRSLVPTGADAGAAPGGAAASDHSEHAAAGTAADTRGNGCPLCTLLAVLRGERPELAAALLDGAMSAVQLARGLVSEQSGQPEQAGQTERPVPQGAAPGPPPERGSAPSGEPALPAATQRRPPERIRIS